MIIKTMALRIDKDNYPIALACLAGGFSGIPLGITLGQALVINQPEGSHDPEWGTRVVLGNFWMPWKLFLEEFEVVDPENKGFENFVEVARIRRAEVKDRDPEPERDLVMEEYNGRRPRRRLGYRHSQAPYNPHNFE